MKRKMSKFFFQTTMGKRHRALKKSVSCQGRNVLYQIIPVNQLFIEINCQSPDKMLPLKNQHLLKKLCKFSSKILCVYIYSAAVKRHEFRTYHIGSSCIVNLSATKNFFRQKHLALLGEKLCSRYLRMPGFPHLSIFFMYFLVEKTSTSQLSCCYVNLPSLLYKINVFR